MPFDKKNKSQVVGDTADASVFLRRRAICGKYANSREIFW